LIWWVWLKKCLWRYWPTVLDLMIPAMRGTGPFCDSIEIYRVLDVCWCIVVIVMEFTTAIYKYLRWQEINIHHWIIFGFIQDWLIDMHWLIGWLMGWMLWRGTWTIWAIVEFWKETTRGVGVRWLGIWRRVHEDGDVILFLMLYFILWINL
jgi:hypothetical protein